MPSWPETRPVPSEDVDGHNVLSFLSGLLMGQLSALSSEGYLKVTAVEDPHQADDGTKIETPIQLASGRRILVTTELIGWGDTDAA